MTMMERSSNNGNTMNFNVTNENNVMNGNQGQGMNRGNGPESCSDGGMGFGNGQMSMVNNRDRQFPSMGMNQSEGMNGNSSNGDSINNGNGNGGNGSASFRNNGQSSSGNGPFNAFPDAQPQMLQMMRKRQMDGFDDEPAAKRQNFNSDGNGNMRQDSNSMFNANDSGMSEANLIPPSKEGIKFYSRNDVLCGRGGGTNVHPGNRRFRDLINANRRAYLKARKNDKPAISRSIVRTIREMNGRFLKKDEKAGLWFEIGDDGAREKTSQALRQRAPEMRKILFEDEQRQQQQQEAFLQRRLMGQNMSNNMSNQMGNFGSGQSSQMNMRQMGNMGNKNMNNMNMNSMNMSNMNSMNMSNMNNMNMANMNMNMGNRGNFGRGSPSQGSSSGNSNDDSFMQRRLMNQSMNNFGSGQSSQMMGSSMGNMNNNNNMNNMGNMNNNMRNFMSSSPSQGNNSSGNSNDGFMQNRRGGSYSDNGPNSSPRGDSFKSNSNDADLLARYNMFKQNNLLAQEKNMLLQRLAMSGLNPEAIQNHQNDIDNMRKQTLLEQNIKPVVPRGA